MNDVRTKVALPIILLAGLAALAMKTPPAAAEGFSYTGRLLDNRGTPVEGERAVIVRVYLEPGDEEPIFEQVHEQVRFEEGYFTVALTDNHQTAEVTDPFSAAEHFRTAPRAFVGVELAGEGPGVLVVVPEFPSVIPGNGCGPSMVYDCAGNCVDQATALAWIGDGYCDDGTYGIDLTCSVFDYDDLDCIFVVPPHSVAGGLCGWCCQDEWCTWCCRA